MENYKDPKYYENKKPVDERYDKILGAPVNEKYSALVYAKIEELEKIHTGGFFSEGIFKIEVETEDGEIDFFVKKIVRDMPGENKKEKERAAKRRAQKYMSKYDSIKKAGLPTFDEAFILNGKYFVTTLLNTNKSVLLATNSGENFPLGTDDINYIKVFKNRLIVNDFQSLVEDIITKLIETANSRNIYIGVDAIAFQVPIKNKNEMGGGRKLKWIIGDYDNVRIDEHIEIYDIIWAISRNISRFIAEYCLYEYKEKYQDILDKETDNAQHKYIK